MDQAGLEDEFSASKKSADDKALMSEDSKFVLTYAMFQ